MLPSSLLSRLGDLSRSLCFLGPCPVRRDGLLGALEFSREPVSVISFASWESCGPRPGSASRRASFFHRAAKSLARPPRSSWWRKRLTIFLTPVSCRMCGVRGKAESCCKYFWSLSGRVLVARRPCSLRTARNSTSSDAISVAGSASAPDSVRCRSAGVSGPWQRLAACSGRAGAAPSAAGQVCFWSSGRRASAGSTCAWRCPRRNEAAEAGRPGLYRAPGSAPLPECAPRPALKDPAHLSLSRSTR